LGQRGQGFSRVHNCCPGTLERFKVHAATAGLPLETGTATPEEIDEGVCTYITISANSKLGRAANRNIPLVFECNAHAGGGAIDLMLVDKGGRPISIVPFDYAGPEAAIDFTEKEGGYNAYLKRVKEDPVLQRHLEKLGFTVETFRRDDWEYFRMVNRMRFHLGKSMGWTYYSGDQCGEDWHWEPGNIGYDVWTGDPIASEPFSEKSYPNSGNPGHALQKLGRDSVAVWGGASGHKQARKLGLEM